MHRVRSFSANGDERPQAWHHPATGALSRWEGGGGGGLGGLIGRRAHQVGVWGLVVGREILHYAHHTSHIPIPHHPAHSAHHAPHTLSPLRAPYCTLGELHSVHCALCNLQCGHCTLYMECMLGLLWR